MGIEPTLNALEGRGFAIKLHPQNFVGFLVGVPGLEPGITRTPCAHVNQLHYTPD